jgi:hypothetical protein
VNARRATRIYYSKGFIALLCSPNVTFGLFGRGEGGGEHTNSHRDIIFPNLLILFRVKESEKRTARKKGERMMDQYLICKKDGERRAHGVIER